MVNKRQVRRNIKQLQRIKTWQLVILLILSCFITATFLRLNNINMVERRTAVTKADSVGMNSITQDRLYDLQRYATAHMNTDMGKGIYLEAAYKRDVRSAYEGASATNNVYKKSQEVCMPQFTSWSEAYVQCTIGELAKYPGSNSLVLPVADTYLHVFASPMWSPDFAGFSLLISVVIFIMIIVRLTSVGVLKLILSHHYKSI